MTSRHYIYISTSKVDMYFGQLSVTRKQKIFAELGFNVGLLHGKIGTERDSLADPVERLAVVERLVRRDHKVRTVGSSANWISDTLRMAPLGTAEDHGLMFYIAEADNHVFALGGSAEHVIGGSTPDQMFSGLSHAPWLLRSLESIVKATNPAVVDGTRRSLKRTLNVGVHPGGKVTPWTKLLNEVSQLLEGQVTQNLQFLARVLFTESWPLTGKRYTLATPLYVALADD